MNMETSILEDDYLTMMEDMDIEAVANGMVHTMNTARVYVEGQARVDMIDALKDVIFELPVQWSMFYALNDVYESGLRLMEQALVRPSHDALAQAVNTIVWDAANNG